MNLKQVRREDGVCVQKINDLSVPVLIQPNGSIDIVTTLDAASMMLFTRIMNSPDLDTLQLEMDGFEQERNKLGPISTTLKKEARLSSRVSGADDLCSPIDERGLTPLQCHFPQAAPSIARDIMKCAEIKDLSAGAYRRERRGRERTLGFMF